MPADCWDLVFFKVSNDFNIYLFWLARWFWKISVVFEMIICLKSVTNILFFFRWIWMITLIICSDISSHWHVILRDICDIWDIFKIRPVIVTFWTPDYFIKLSVGGQFINYVILRLYYMPSDFKVLMFLIILNFQIQGSIFYAFRYYINLVIYGE